MEMVLKNGFCEMEQNELLNVDGGEWQWYDYILAVISPGHAVSKIIEEDLENCYNNAYNEVIVSVSGGNAK